MTPRELPRLQKAILTESGLPPVLNARVLDLGCGNGAVVRGWLDLGFDAHGCDLRFKQGPEVQTLVDDGRLKLIESSPYCLPYPDGHFDILVSAQVMEHVRDYPATLAEMRRVLRSDGCCLHLFPAHLTPIEPHVFVPGATILQTWRWLAFWALLGVRKADQKKMGWRKVADQNHAYLRASTNYLSGRAIAREFCAHFTDVRFVERAFLRHSPNPRGRRLYRLGRRLPVLFSIYRTFWARAVLARP